MDRRVFVGAITVGGGLTESLVAMAQQAKTVRRIGILSTDAPETQAPEWINTPLRALGWVEGQNLHIERRFASGNIERLKPLAEELVRLEVEIIGTLSTPAGLAAKNATKTIPIVIYSTADAVGTGLVASLARPGGNITGFTLVTAELTAKRLELLREIVPGLLRVGILETSSPYFRVIRPDLEQSFRSLGVQPMFFEVATLAEMERAITEMARRGAQALMVPQEPLFYENPVPLMVVALRFSLPTIGASGSIVEAGGLAVLSHSGQEQRERFAWFIDKILRGAKPAELPIQQPTRFELVINVKAAKSLGLAIPQSVLLRADRVVE
jgi:putative ABC transport system substrate-binding protein